MYFLSRNFSSFDFSSNIEIEEDDESRAKELAAAALVAKAVHSKVNESGISDQYF